MTQKQEDHITEQLNFVAKLMDEDKHQDAVNLVNELKTQYPGEFRIIYTWLVVASFCRNHQAVCEHAPSIKKLTNDEMIQAKIEFMISCAAWEFGKFELAIESQINAILHFCNCAKAGLVPDYNTTSRTKRLDSKSNVTAYAISILKKLHSQGIKCAPFYGTLLGLTRSGKLIGHDKDIDLICGMETIGKALSWFEDQGYVNAGPTRFENYRGLKHPSHGVQIDLSGFYRCRTSKRTGLIRKNGPEEWDFVQEFDEIEIIEEPSADGPYYTLKDPVKILEKLYGAKWRIPDPGYVPFIMDMSTSRTGGLAYYQVHHLLRCWNRGEITKVRALIGTLLNQHPANHLYVYIRDVLKELKNY